MAETNPRNFARDPRTLPLLPRGGGLTEYKPQTQTHSSGTNILPSATPIAAETVVSSLNRKRKPSLSMDHYLIIHDSMASTNTASSMSPSFANDRNTQMEYSSRRDDDLFLQFTQHHQKQARRVSMCGSSLKKARSHSPVREVLVETSSPDKPSMFDPNAFKQILLQRSTETLKNIPYMPGTKPKVEIVEYLPDEAAAMALFQQSNGIYIQPFSNTHDIIKWNIQGNDEINAWLQKRDEYIHPVESGDWNVHWWAVYNPTYAWVKFDSCEAQYDRQTRKFTLILRTFLYATGKDENGRPSCVCIE